LVNAMIIFRSFSDFICRNARIKARPSRALFSWPTTAAEGALRFRRITLPIHKTPCSNATSTYVDCECVGKTWERMSAKGVFGNISLWVVHILIW
jgi:hypothetical protein